MVSKPASRCRLAAAALLLCQVCSAAPYTPASDQVVLAHLPDSLRALAPPSRPLEHDQALTLAQQQIHQARREGDPRFLGYAEATLEPLLSSEPNDPAVGIMMATIEQSRHQYLQARSRLKKILKAHPEQGQGWLTLAVIERVQANYHAARQACRESAGHLPPSATVICQASIEALTGPPGPVYQRLQRLADSPLPMSDAQRRWMFTELAEMAWQQGDAEQTLAYTRQGLASEPGDRYLRFLKADAQLALGNNQAVIDAWQHQLAIDGGLLRLAIAAQRAGHPRAEHWADLYQQRLKAAEQARQQLHLREQARFQLEVLKQPQAALATAKRNWQIQKEPADLRILTATARACHDRDTLALARQFIDQHGLQDQRVASLLGETP
ncbi:hypothetical protein A11A3_07088 [Alcanivorax hongdengensis A-11-3]|uniref:Uncharacterized protein n=1 Tax=Alcanivorax hongdengensis A-11-3 TaxID=1177179 RepID=L0WDB9_9GAMM|nr:hypothetical protein [Alcanivorax hongdengensis]EKF74768.1 hypothetical protein A11A3_07088 [Alcanivorax hongdengensis A-11-3]